MNSLSTCRRTRKRYAGASVKMSHADTPSTSVTIVRPTTQLSGEIRGQPRPRVIGPQRRRRCRDHAGTLVWRGRLSYAEASRGGKFAMFGLGSQELLVILGIVLVLL